MYYHYYSYKYPLETLFRIITLKSLKFFHIWWSKGKNMQATTVFCLEFSVVQKDERAISYAEACSTFFFKLKGRLIAKIFQLK